MFDLGRKKKRLINHFFHTVRGEDEYSERQYVWVSSWSLIRVKIIAVITTLFMKQFPQKEWEKFYENTLKPNHRVRGRVVSYGSGRAKPVATSNTQCVLVGIKKVHDFNLWKGKPGQQFQPADYDHNESLLGILNEGELEKEFCKAYLNINTLWQKTICESLEKPNTRRISPFKKAWVSQFQVVRKWKRSWPFSQACFLFFQSVMSLFTVDSNNFFLDEFF